MSHATITLSDAAWEAGISPQTLRNRLKVAGLLPVAGRRYDRGEILRIAAAPLKQGRVTVCDDGKSATIILAVACRLAGVHRTTLENRLRKQGIRPIQGRYDRETIMSVAALAPKKGRPKAGSLPSGRRQMCTVAALAPKKGRPKACRPIRKKRRPPQHHSGDPCSRCGHYDHGNDCRGGLCLDCFCHDYCRERRL